MSVLTGLVVAALTGGGDANLGLSVLVTLGVAFSIALELTVLLSDSIARPLNALHEGIVAVEEGRYDVRIPVTTSDDLGELAHGFNRMVAGLAERERLRQAFGTYLDKEVAEYILSDGFSAEGIEVDVSILFCDVRDFTGFAAQAEPTEVVAALNGLFEAIVPIVARHGGHVDKFVGDGLLAVFGAPEGFADHADRAVAAGREIVDAVERGRAGDLRVGVGINSGPVIAGAIGGAGRLNFSVIGDAVNVAARVEAATRDDGDPLLIAADTRDALVGEVALVSRGRGDAQGPLGADRAVRAGGWWRGRSRLKVGCRPARVERRAWLPNLRALAATRPPASRSTRPTRPSPRTSVRSPASAIRRCAAPFPGSRSARWRSWPRWRSWLP